VRTRSLTFTKLVMWRYIGLLLSRYNTWLQTGRSGFDPRQRQRIFPLVSVSRPALRPTQPPILWVLGSFPGLKRVRGVTLTTHPYVPTSRMSRSYSSSPPRRLHGIAGEIYFHLAIERVVTVVKSCLGSQTSYGRGEVSDRKEVSLRFWYETSAPLRLFHHLFIMLRTATHVSNG
jgi:hypothetical protein